MDHKLVVRFLEVHRHLNEELQEQCLRHICHVLYAAAQMMSDFVDEQFVAAFASNPVCILRWSCHYCLSPKLLHSLRLRALIEDPWQWTFLLQWAIAINEPLSVFGWECHACIATQNIHLWRALALYSRRFPDELPWLASIMLPPPLLLLMHQTDSLDIESNIQMIQEAPTCSSADLLDRIDRALSFQYCMYDLDHDDASLCQHSIQCDCPDY